MVSQERLQVVVEFSVEGFQQAMQQFRDGLTNMSSTFQGFNSDMKDVTKNGKEMGDQLKTVGEELNKGKKETTDWTSKMSDFRVQMLGVLFFSQAVAGAFGSLLSPAANTLGLFELLSNVLIVVFLPVLLEVLPLILELSKNFMEMDESTKLAIGKFILFGFIIAKVLAIGITFGLGMINMISLVVKTGIALFTFFRNVVGLSLSSLFAVLIIIIIGFIAAWKTNFGNIKQWVGVIFTGIKNIFSGVIDFMKGNIKVFVGIFTGNFDLIQEGFGQMWTGMKSTALGMIQVITGIVTTIGLSVFRVIVAIINGAISLINKIPGVNLKTIAIGETAGLVKQVKEAQTVSIDQTINIETTTSGEDVKTMIAEANEEYMRKIQRNEV